VAIKLKNNKSRPNETKLCSPCGFMKKAVKLKVQCKVHK